jgi:hypothetical protein
MFTKISFKKISAAVAVLSSPVRGFQIVEVLSGSSGIISVVDLAFGLLLNDLTCAPAATNGSSCHACAAARPPCAAPPVDCRPHFLAHRAHCTAKSAEQERNQSSLRYNASNRAHGNKGASLQCTATSLWALSTQGSLHEHVQKTCGHGASFTAEKIMPVAPELALKALADPCTVKIVLQHSTNWGSGCKQRVPPEAHVLAS